MRAGEGSCVIAARPVGIDDGVVPWRYTRKRVLPEGVPDDGEAAAQRPERGINGK